MKMGIILWLFNIAMENCPFTDDFPIKTSIYNGFAIAMLNNQMVFRVMAVDMTVKLGDVSRSAPGAGANVETDETATKGAR